MRRRHHATEHSRFLQQIAAEHRHHAARGEDAGRVVHLPALEGNPLEPLRHEWAVVLRDGTSADRTG